MREDSLLDVLLSRVSSRMVGPLEAVKKPLPALSLSRIRDRGCHVMARSIGLQDVLVLYVIRSNCLGMSHLVGGVILICPNIQ